MSAPGTPHQAPVRGRRAAGRQPRRLLSSICRHELPKLLAAGWLQRRGGRRQGHCPLRGGQLGLNRYRRRFDLDERAGSTAAAHLQRLRIMSLLNALSDRCNMVLTSSESSRAACVRHSNSSPARMRLRTLSHAIRTPDSVDFTIAFAVPLAPAARAQVISDAALPKISVKCTAKHPMTPPLTPPYMSLDMMLNTGRNMRLKRPFSSACSSSYIEPDPLYASDSAKFNAS